METGQPDPAAPTVIVRIPLRQSSLTSFAYAVAMQRIEFEQAAVASLRRRVAEVEEINEDLVAFARGHAHTVATIHDAVLAMMAADSPEALAHVLAVQWPRILRVDEVAFAWRTSTGAYCGDHDGIRSVEPRLVERMVDILPSVTMRNVERGHPIFGASCETIISEALIRLDGAEGLGMVALGQRRNPAAEGYQGAKLLRFLGASLSHMLARWPPR